jgi:hypothetical protein
MTGIELLVPLAGEILKFIVIEQNMKRLAAQAGASPEQLEAAVKKIRVEFAALDPSKLPEV